MADGRFFSRQPPLSVRDICEMTGVEPFIITGDGAAAADDSTLSQKMEDVCPLDRADSQHVSFLDNSKYITSFSESRAGACFIRSKHLAKAPLDMIALVSDEPYRSYALLAQYFYPRRLPKPDISPHANISKSAFIGENCSVGANVVISERVEIGKECVIQPGAFIGEGVVIGDNVYIGANATISYSIIGNNVILHAGAHIGQDGFGFAMGRDGHVKVPQLGRVIIDDNVEIGAGTCIDRGTGPDTHIGAGSKIDNLVQIGHNVQVGRNSIIVAQNGIAGSCRIGDGAVLGGQVGIAGHLKIGAGAKLAAQSGVINDIPPGKTYGGTPAIPIKDWHRQSVTLARMSKKKMRHEND